MLAVCNASLSINTVFTALSIFMFGSLCHANKAMGQPVGLQPGEVVKLAPALTPRICIATAETNSGETTVRVSVSEMRLKKRVPGESDPKDWMMCWRELDPLELGKQIRAYSPSGEKIDDAALLKALAKPVAVACFMRMLKNDPEQPDPFYSSVFREDLVVLVFEAKEWFPE